MKLLMKALTIASLSTLLCTSLLASDLSTLDNTISNSTLDNTISNSTSNKATTDSATLKPILTLEDAISAALSNNNSLTLNSKQHEVLSEQLKYMDNIASYSYQQLYISRHQNEQQREFLKDKISSDITKRNNKILLLEAEIKTVENDIVLQKETIKKLEAQQKAGLIIPLQVDSSKLELKNLEASKLSKEETLKSEKLVFLMLTNKNLDNYRLENTMHFEPFRLENPKSFFQSKADQYLKYQEQLAQLQSDNIFENFVNPLTGSAYAPTYAEYLSAKYSASSATLGLEDSRDQLVQSLLSSYASLIGLEEQINLLHSQLTLLEKQLATAQVQYKVGLMTQLDYKKQVNAIEDLEYNLLALVNNYNTLVGSLQKPWS